MRYHLRVCFKMEREFHHKSSGFGEDADLMNDETFGMDLDIGSMSDDWELNHEKISKLLEIEHDKVKKSSPLRINQKTVQSHNYNAHSNRPSHKDLPSGDEEVIIESSISQLGLDDDDADDASNFSRHSGRSYEFKESMESWMSPSRGKDLSNSFNELISPGDGVWASPSRDQIVPSFDRHDKKEQDENILKKLFGGHNIVTAKKSIEKSPAPQAINVEDLERGLKKEHADDFSQPTIIERRQTPTPPIMHAPQMAPFTSPPPGFGLHPMPGEIPRMNLPPNMGVRPMMHPDVSPLFLMNQQMRFRVLPKNIIGLPPMPLSPQFLARHPYPNMMDRRTPDHNVHRGSGQRGRGRYNSNYRQNQNSNRSWNRSENQSWNQRRREPPEPPLVEMQASKMMTSKEKEWIFKIGIMSLLSGDFYASDYYFINFMNKKLLEQSSPKRESEKHKEEKEKTKNLVSYAQKHQQTKESHKPVKFEGSLGKLSITSVHHPRQLMDLSTPEHETQTISRIQEGRRKKYTMYGLVEKMYDAFLSVVDLNSELAEAPPEEHEEMLTKRRERIDKLFEMFKVKLYTSIDDTSDTDHFLHMMSICKARRLLERSLLIFTQEQTESLIVSIIHVLPALLKKDNKDKALQHLPERVEIALTKSSEKFKMRCLQMLRKINLKMLLTYQMSVDLLAGVLDSLSDKNPEHNIEWSYYFCEVPKLSIELPPDVFERNQEEIQKLKSVLGVGDLLINID